MQPISYARHQFPAEIIRHAVWLYLRFTLSYRDVEELLAERGIETSYETVRRWVLKFGPLFARKLRHLRPRAAGTWHLDEMVILSANSPERGAEGDPCSPPSMSACSPQLRSTAPNRGAPATEPIRRQYQMFVRIGGKQMYLWRAVDAEGEVLDVLLQAKRDTKAARKLMRKLLKRQGMAPDEWV